MARKGIDREMIKNLRLYYPTYSLQKIADEYERARSRKITRELVRQILEKEGLPTRRTSRPIRCYACKNHFPYRAMLHTTISRQPVYLCNLCFEQRREQRREERERSLIFFQCEICRTSFALPLYIVNSKSRKGLRTRWCSKRCQGKWLSRIPHWEEKRLEWAQRRKTVMELRRKGLSAKAVGELLHISLSVVYKISALCGQTSRKE